MATNCPCGCGRAIRRISKTTAERAVFLASLSELPEHLAKVYEESDPVAARRMEMFGREGMSYSRQMLAAVHHETGFDLPSANDLGDWEAEALELVPVAQRADPEWFAKWLGPVRNRMTGKGQH